jgi:hypothetical protein
VSALFYEDRLKQAERREDRLRDALDELYKGSRNSYSVVSEWVMFVCAQAVKEANEMRES